MGFSDMSETKATPPASPAEAGQQACVLCETAGGQLIWANDAMRVILVEDACYPGFTRVISRKHVAEMTDLRADARAAMMSAVWTVESVQRAVLAPHKVNLASLGNMVPHVHWHVIPRWRDDVAFPDAIWAPPHRSEPGAGVASASGLLVEYAHALRSALDTIFSGD